MKQNKKTKTHTKNRHIILQIQNKSAKDVILKVTSKNGRISHKKMTIQLKTRDSSIMNHKEWNTIFGVMTVIMVSISYQPKGGKAKHFHTNRTRENFI